MAASAGYLAVVQIGPTTYTTINNVKTAEIQVGTEIYDVTSLGNAWKVQIPGVASYTLKLDGNYDMSDTEQALLQADVIVNPGQIVSWKIYPAGTGSGAKSYSGTAIIKTFDLKIDVKSEQSIAWDFEGSGPIVYA